VGVAGVLAFSVSARTRELPTLPADCQADAVLHDMSCPAAISGKTTYIG
jgi:hypothetical protein